jgi:hypothetical protein
MSSPEHQPQSDLTGHSANGRTHRRAQLAAAGALVVSVVFLVGLLFLIADDPLGIVLAFVSVFTIAFFSWFFVTTRGYRRLLAVPAVFLALAVLFTWAYDHKVALPVLIVLLVLFGLVARYAVRHARTPVHIARRHARPAEPAQRGVLIINPNSGGGKAERGRWSANSTSTPRTQKTGVTRGSLSSRTTRIRCDGFEVPVRDLVLTPADWASSRHASAVRAESPGS